MRKPDKNRVLQAVRHIESKDIAFMEIDPDMELINRILGRDFSLGLHAYELPAKDYVELNRRMGNDIVYFAEIWRLGRKEKVDEAGRRHYIDGIMKTPQTLGDLWYPDLGKLEGHLEEVLAAMAGSGLGISCVNHCASTVVRTAVGYEDYWLTLVDDPGFILEFQKKIHDYCLRELEMYLRHDVDMIHVALGIGSKAGPMCSRAMIEQFEYPLLREQIARAKQAGGIVHLHIDGNVKELIDDFIAMGVDILNPVEPCDGAQDIYAIKEQYGDRITLHGNIDVTGVLLQGTPEEVTRDVNEHLARLAVGGGYIAASSHNLHPAIPLDNFYAMRDAVHTFSFRKK